MQFQFHRKIRIAAVQWSRVLWLGSRFGGREAAAEALKSKMAASQIGPCANLDADQIESGVARVCDENRKIRGGFRGQNAIGRRNVRKR
jgi:hypothetical protein